MANVLGSFGVNFVFFRLPLIPLLLTLSLSALSGGLGGLLAYAIANQVNRLGSFKEPELEEEIDIRHSGDPRLVDPAEKTNHE